MIPEVSAAASFVCRLLRSRGRLSDAQLQVFRDCLAQALSEHYQHHWFPDRPQKGSGYRCIRINHEMDPLIGRAAGRIGLTSGQLFSLLPRELTLWVDPYEVSYRIGEDGSICVLYEAEPPVSSPAPLPYDQMANCKNRFMMSGRTSPPKNYLMMVLGVFTGAHTRFQCNYDTSRLSRECIAIKGLKRTLRKRLQKHQSFCNSATCGDCENATHLRLARFRPKTVVALHNFCGSC
ncbi:hypothetical protein M9458_054826 [Cirrhinus mrigala]|uniref:Anti-proliferative protein domain-containing protein n=1 Tax=Cirrhinus mrigala TaxID=683832 RepID=A0ABD0MNR3_CIRMR